MRAIRIDPGGEGFFEFRQELARAFVNQFSLLFEVGPRLPHMGFRPAPVEILPVRGLASFRPSRWTKETQNRILESNPDRCRIQRLRKRSEAGAEAPTSG
jgi:hypothetical protein